GRAAPSASPGPHPAAVAGILAEPLHRCPPPRPGFLRGLRELTAARGLVLIFDETVTGFRLAYGGAQEYYGVRPDVAALGKALGGGHPLGAVAARGELLDLGREDRLGEPRFGGFAARAGGHPGSAHPSPRAPAAPRRAAPHPRR